MKVYQFCFENDQAKLILNADSIKKIVSYYSDPLNSIYILLFETAETFRIYNLITKQISEKYIINFDFDPITGFILNNKNLTILSNDRKRFVTFLIQDNSYASNIISNIELKEIRFKFFFFILFLFCVHFFLVIHFIF